MALLYTTVTGTFLDGTGVPLTASPVFTASAVVTANGIPEVTPGSPVQAQISNGQLLNKSGGPLALLAQQAALAVQGPTGFWFWTVSGLPGGMPGFSFMLASSPSTVDITALINSPAVGSSIPLTTLGDMLYENATPALARLPGNTATAKNFLTQTGTGSVSAAPAWGTIAAGDLPTASTSVQGAVVIDGTAADIQPSPGTQAAGAVGKPSDAGHVHGQPPVFAPTGLTGATTATRYAGGTASGPPVAGTFAAGDFVVDQTGVQWICRAAGTPGTWCAAGDQPWQFRPEAYGAKGNGKVLGDVVTNSTTTITSASAGFTSGDAGKYIMIHGANGSTGGPLLTTIASVTNSTTAVLAAAATASVSNCPAVYGTDDVAAINSAISAAKTYALAHSYYGEVLFGSKIYILGAAPTQQTSPAQYNAQILIPYPDLAGATQKLVIALTGYGDAGYCQFFESLVPNVTGSALVSMQTAPSTPSGTFGNQSVIGGPSAGGAFTGAFANTKAVITGLSVWCPLYTNMYAYDLGFLGGMYARQSSAHIFAPTGFNVSAVQPYLKTITAVAFTGSIGSGWRTPTTTNNDDCVMDTCTAEGYECAFRVFDHLTFYRLNAIYSDVVMKFDGTQGGSSVSHGLFGTISPEAYNGGLLIAGGTIHCDINWDSENASVTYDVSDSGNGLHGVFRFRDPPNNRFPTISGAANLKVICEQLGPGFWSGAPAAPASTVSQQNTAWRDAWITLSATTGITVITVDGQTTGLTAGNAVATTIRVPSGKSYAVTYAGTLTTKWWLD